MPRDLGQTNENRQNDDWERIDSEFERRTQLQRKWEAEHDAGPEFERAARPLGPDYGADRPRHREIPPEVAAEFGRTPEELQRLRERDPRGAGRHIRQTAEADPPDQMGEHGSRTSDALRHEPTRQDESNRPGPAHSAEPGRFAATGRSEQYGRPGELAYTDGRAFEPPVQSEGGQRRAADPWSAAPRAADARLPAPTRAAERTDSPSPTWTAESLGPDRWTGYEDRSPPAERNVPVERHVPERHVPDERTVVPGERSGPNEWSIPGERSGLGDRLGLEHAPPGRREAPRHLADVPTDERSGTERLDRSDLETPGTERAYPPSWLTSADRPPPIEQTRTYHQVGYLDEPLPSEQQALEEVVPRDDEGNFERFSDPRQDWTMEVNGVGPILEPGRGSNCLDCTLSAISTWHGEPRVSAPRHAEYDPNGDPVRTGERDGPKRAEQWLGHDFEMIDADAEPAFGEIERRMLDAGHGASAVIVNGWAPGGAHAWNAFNYEGKVYWVDTQLGDVSERPLYPQAVDVRAIMMDSEGNKA